MAPGRGVWLIVLAIACATTQDFDDYDERYAEFITTESERGLFPSIFNLATNALIHSTATCGERGPEEFCKLVEHVLQRKAPGNGAPQCDVCNANELRKRHPIEFAIDGTRRWWQSPSLHNGLEFENINITLDLRQEYQVAYIIIKMGNAPRPGSWVLEKSLDAVKWEPWQYFAINDAECVRLFGIPATAGVPRFQADDEVHCTSEFSKLTPLEYGEIHISLVNGRPGSKGPSLELQKFTRTRYVRMRLIDLRTLNADLLIVTSRGTKLDKSVTMRYFYSISDISIGGQCICYGHAESCPADPVTGQFKCECRHNTCGESCNRCCPLYNQLAWKPGTNAQPNICQQCQCFNHAEACEYDEELALNQLSVTPEGVFEGGGRCIDCQHNTEGINCERCKVGYYRPSGMSHYRADACRSCDCDVVGSESAECVKDDQSALNGLAPGDCLCKPGFGGRRCERCAPGFRNYPKCEPCPCNQAGSLNFDNCEYDKCMCKANVEGLHCDRCKPGTIHLSKDNPQGCQPCFCFGLSTNCTEKHWTTGKIHHTKGWLLSDLTGGRDVEPEIENGEVLMFNANQNKDRSLYYWKAPREFNGNLLTSYGGFIHYYVYYVPNDSADVVPVADVVIEGNGVKLEHHSRIAFHPRENVTVQIALREGPGWYNSQSRRPADKADIMRALSGVSVFMIRAMYNHKQLQSSIFGFSLDKAIEPPANKSLINPNDIMMRAVEVCECPEGTSGLSCESCPHGFRRVENQLFNGRCEKCDCNGHTHTCDSFTGECTDCLHNTTGSRCELCLSGHYGNPSLGGELGSCKPCACPFLNNSRSNECALAQLVVSVSAASSLEDAYVCTACEPGYEGNKCEVCSDGYFGNPLAINGSCTECDCNGNIDSMAIGNCDTKTGECLKCIGHTTGSKCEKCLPHHYGSAMTHSCHPCNCHRQGAVSLQCDKSNGTCKCKSHYIGQHCDRCAEGHGDVENGCEECACNEIGSLGPQCDAVSGQCSCKQGVFGKRCDKCRPSYFAFSDSGCQFCNCDTYGSIEDGKCDNVTGACQCRKFVEGQMCEKCVPGYFNISSGLGCQECDCNKIGAEGTACDLIGGQCECKPGVAGLKCDQCAPNHWGLSETGCKACATCPAPGQVCDSVTGECVCPPNTEGELCERCAPDSWDYDPLQGCKKCECSMIGAASTNCDAKNGQCECKAEFVGLKCDHCSHGFYNFPVCEACDCNPDGTDPLQCKDGLCLCDEHGKCPCKKNVIGEKCDSCREGSFSLEAANLLGCTECFCFNRSDSCEQCSLVWKQVYAEDQSAVFEEPWEYYTQRHNVRLLQEHNGQFKSYPTDDTPLYWQLPKTFLGDRTGSYNGFLRFKIHNADNRLGIDGVRPNPQLFRYFPQVIIIGNNRIELEHYPFDISEDGKYKIRVHEAEWRSRLSPEVPVTRKVLMVALQNLQGIYIRASYNYPARGDKISISEISLDVAATDAHGTPAIGVESCSACPLGYGGLSCQDPAEGFCRKKTRDFLNAVDDIALVGWSEPCACNAHTTTCNPDTCVCTDCDHNTYGDRCELCKPGFVGDATRGGISACTKCACPLTDNSFSETCISVDYGRGYLCDACKPGYTGQYCEACVSGYFGDPSSVGGQCERCDCHPDGSLHGSCHSLTGECECKPGVTGRDCSRCQERHAFINRKCTSCDQGCYLELMLDVDELFEILEAQNFSNLRPIPWKRVSRIENNTKLLFEFVGGLKLHSEEANLLDIEGKSKYAREADAIVDEGDFMLERVELAENKILNYTAEAEAIALHAQQIFRASFNTTQFLKHFARYGGTTVGTSLIEIWVAESEAHMNATMERGEYVQKRFDKAQTTRQKAEDLEKRVTQNKLNDTAFSYVAEALRDVEGFVEDFRSTLYESAKKDAADADRMSKVVNKRIDRYKLVVADIETLKAEAEDGLKNANSDVSNAKTEKLLDTFDSYNKIKEDLAAIAEFVGELSNISNRYAQLTDEYDEAYVVKAEEHAKKLQAHSTQVGAAFRSTKAEAANPLKASQAYEDIVGGLQNATKAAEQAKKAAESAQSQTMGTGESSLTVVVKDSQAQSDVVSNDSLSIKTMWEEDDLKSQDNDLKERLSVVNEQIIDVTRRKDSFKPQLDNFDDQHERMSGLQAMAREAEVKAEKAREAAELLSQGVSELTIATDKLTNSTSAGILKDIDKILTAKEDLASASDNLSKTNSLINANRDKIDSIQRKIELLKEKIGEAKEKAQLVPVALRADERGRCRRTFISPAAPSSSNSFNIKFRPLKGVPNTVVYATRTKSRRTLASEYVALEVLDHRVVAHWNIGNGKKKVTNTHPINFIPTMDRSDSGTWYHIDVVRSGDFVNVTVALHENIINEATPLRSDPVIVSAGRHTSNADSIFNTVPGDTLISLGVTEENAKEMGLSTHEFKGIIGEMRVDDQPVELWAFHESTYECEGASPPPPPAATTQHFRDGFAQFSLSINEHAVSSISCSFSTHSPEGLLYFRGDPVNGDFVALYLEKGHVVFKINLGKSSIAEIRSANSYSNGQEHTIKAVRNGNEIHLQVDSELDRRSSVIPGSNTRLNIPEAEHYIAGVPPEFPVQQFAKFGIQWRGFIGCIFSVKPTQVNELNLAWPSRSLRRVPGCKTYNGHLTADRLIGFNSPGYFITNGFEISTNSTFSFVFRTRDENGTLVFMSSHMGKNAGRTEHEGYIAFYLFRGFLVAHFGIDAERRQSALTIRSTSTFNDGNVHSVFFARDGDNVRVRVDDREIGADALVDEATVGSPDFSLFLGGFPPRIHPQSSEIPAVASLTGCISDLTHNYRRLPLIPIQHKAQLGSCTLEEPHLLVDHTADIDAPPSERRKSPVIIDNHLDHSVISNDVDAGMIDGACASFDTAKFDGTGAARFGIAKSSHSRLNFDRENAPDLHTFSIEFEVRTDSPSGILWTWANYKNYTRYFILSIDRGFLNFDIKGHKEPKHVEYLERRIDDGQWHSVRLRKNDRTITIQVDEGLKDLIIPDCPHPKVMRRRMYIGGLISAHRNLGLSLPASLIGCIRQFAVNSVVYPLLSDTSRDIIPCGTEHSKATYIHADGYAVFEPLAKSAWDGAPSFEVDFRPLAPNGTIFALLSNSNPTDRISIEIHDDKKVHVSVVHEKSDVRIHDMLPTLRPLCDGGWHTMRLEIYADKLIIFIDQEKNEIAMSLLPAVRQLFLKLPLHLGGVSSVSMRATDLLQSISGCFKNLVINGRPTYFEHALRRNKVAIDGCPFV